MKILFVITGLGLGGAERQVCDLAGWMKSYGHEVMIAHCLEYVAVQPIDVDIQLVSLGLTRNPFSLIRCLYRLVSCIRAYRPTIVHSHMIHANLLTRFIRPFTEIPFLISTAHSVNEGGAFRMFLYRMTDKFANFSTNVSAQAVDEFYKKRAVVNKGRMIPVPNGIDVSRFKFSKADRDELRKFYNIRDDQKVILAVGRLVSEKDYPNLFDAFYRLDLKSNVHLWIIGDGPKRSELEGYASELNLESRITFLGIKKDVERYYSAADVFVLSSAYEGFGLVVAEAMSSERIVVATDCGGVREVVGSCGYLVPPQNSPALSKALDAALEIGPDERSALGLKARRFVEDNYSLEAIGARWLSMYKYGGDSEA